MQAEGSQMDHQSWPQRNHRAGARGLDCVFFMAQGKRKRAAIRSKTPNKTKYSSGGTWGNAVSPRKISTETLSIQQVDDWVLDTGGAHLNEALKEIMLCVEPKGGRFRSITEETGGKDLLLQESMWPTDCSWAHSPCLLTAFPSPSHWILPSTWNFCLVTESGWSRGAKGKGRDEDYGIFAPNDALAQPRGWGVATGNLGNVSKRMFETLAKVWVPDPDRIISMRELVRFWVRVKDRSWRNTKEPVCSQICLRTHISQCSRQLEKGPFSPPLC